MYSKYAGRKFIIEYGYGVEDCNSNSLTSIALGFTEGCMSQNGDPGNPGPPTYATYNISSMGIEFSLFSNSKCEGPPDSKEFITYEQMEFNRCFPNDGDVLDEDNKSSKTVTTFMIAPTRNPTRAPTYKKGAPTPRPTLIPTMQRFPYVLTENFESSDCTGPAMYAHIDVSGICDIGYSYVFAPTAQDPNNYNKTREAGSFKISGEGANRFRQQFSDDKCQTPVGPKRSDGPLGNCLTSSSSDPSSVVRSSKFTGITNLDGLFKKFEGYLANSNYLGKDCTGGLTSVSLQDTSKTCYPGSGYNGGGFFYKQTCNATSLFYKSYSDSTCGDSQLQSVSTYKPSCYNKSPESIDNVALSSKQACMVPIPVTKSPVKQPTPSVKPTVKSPVTQPTTKPAPSPPTKTAPTKPAPTTTAPTKPSPKPAPKPTPTKPAPGKQPTKKAE